MGGATNWTFTVGSTTGFPSSGVVQVDGHTVTYTGKGSTTFTGCNNNPPNTVMSNGDAVGAFVIVQGDPGGSNVFRTRVESLGIDCSTTAGSGGVYSNRINEQSGGKDLIIRNYMGIGLRVERALSPTSGTSQNWGFEQMHIIGSASAPSSVKSIALSNNGDACRFIRDVTVTFAGSSAVAGSTAFLLDGCTGSFSDINIEGHAVGFEIAKNVASFALQLNNVSAGGGAGTMTDLVHIGGSLDYAGLSIQGMRNPGNAATNTIHNQDGSHLLTSTNTVVGYYTVGRTYTITTDAS